MKVEQFVMACGVEQDRLRALLPDAAQFGFDRVLCICDADNAASETVILKNGGVLEDERYDPEEAVTVRRYWIDLPK